MTRQQSTIIWLGLALIAMNIIVHWGQLKPVIFGSGNAALLNKTSTAAGISTIATKTPTPTPANAQVT